MKLSSQVRFSLRLTQFSVNLFIGSGQTCLHFAAKSEFLDGAYWYLIKAALSIVSRALWNGMMNSPSNAGTLFGITNGMSSIPAFIAPLTSGLLMEGEVRRNHLRTHLSAFQFIYRWCRFLLLLKRRGSSSSVWQFDETCVICWHSFAVRWQK